MPERPTKGRWLDGITNACALTLAGMNNRSLLALLLLGALAGAGCRDKPPDPAPIQPRADFAPEEFGIGKPHTPDPACNRSIDALLDKVRRCYNSRGGDACQLLQAGHNRRIARLKNSVRCRR